MKDRTLRERVARFIRRRRSAGFKPSALALELGRGVMSLPIVDSGEDAEPAREIIFRRTGTGAVEMQVPDAGFHAQIVPDGDNESMTLLAAAFGEMSIRPSESFYVKIDDDGNGFSLHKVNGVSPEMVQAALESAARQFAFYEEQHLAKGTPESADKASVNREMKLLMQRALGAEVYAPGEMGFLPIGSGGDGFDVAVQHLVDRGNAHGVDHSDMMRSLMNATIDIGLDHGWTEKTRMLIARDESGRLGFEVVAPTTPRGQEAVENRPETAQESDSGASAPSAPLTSAAAILAWLRGKAEYARKRGDRDIQRIIGALVEGIEKDLVDDLPVDPESALRQFYIDCHGRNVKAGWWNDLATGQPKKRSVGELFVLMVTELAEAYKAYTAGDMDDKLPHLPGLGVELGDVQIRLADFCGALMEGSIVEHSGVRNPGDAMFREIVAIAEKYEAIRKTDAAKGEVEEGDSVGVQDVAAMTFEKLAFNAQRPDHKIENRLKDDGKRT